MIKNNHKIKDDIIEIYIKRQNGDEYTCLIDLADYDLISSYDASWCVKVIRGRPSYVFCSKRINKKLESFPLHKILLSDKCKIVDHIDRNICNNTRNNLRYATKTENNRNKSKIKDKTSMYIGVSLTIDGKYRLHVKEEKSTIFSNEIACANAYNHYAQKYYGEFANLNDVPYMSVEECELYRFKVGETSKSHGIHYCKNKDKWIAQFYVSNNGKKGKQIYLGSYDFEKDAISAYNNYIRKV